MCMVLGFNQRQSVKPEKAMCMVYVQAHALWLLHIMPLTFIFMLCFSGYAFVLKLRDLRYLEYLKTYI